MANGTRQFMVSPDHVELLRRANISWEDSEFGAPCVDPKRPYGNSSVYEDMWKILGIGEMCPEDETWLEETHRGTETALQIVLATGKMKAGLYEADKYGRNWRLVKTRHARELKG